MKRVFGITLSALVVFLALLSTSITGRTDTIYNNLNAAFSGAGIVSTGPLADSFSTGSSEFSLTQVSLSLTDEVAGDAGSVVVSLLSDNSTSPGALLTTIGTVAGSSLPLYPLTTNVTLTLTSPYTLAANTRYWIELSSGSGGVSLGMWADSLDTSGVGVAGEYSYLSYFVSANSPSGAPFKMTITGTPVPESGTLSLLGLGLLGMALVMRRRRVA